MDSTTIWGIVTTVIMAILGAVVPILKIKGNKYIKLLHMIIDAFDDENVTTAEFNNIVLTAKKKI